MSIVIRNWILWLLWIIWNKLIRKFMGRRESIIGEFVIQMLGQKELAFIWINLSVQCLIVTRKSTLKEETIIKNT